MTKPIMPGATIGVLGSGQLGRMFAMAARRMGYLVHTFSPETDTPTGQISDVEITAPYEDLDAVRSQYNIDYEKRRFWRNTGIRLPRFGMSARLTNCELRSRKSALLPY